MGGKKQKAEYIEKKAAAAVRPLIEKNGFELWDVLFEKEGSLWLLKIYFSKNGELDMDDCEALTQPINDVIDKMDFIDDIDVVEVGSPGLSAKLRTDAHFQYALGKTIRVHYKTSDGKKLEQIGTLTAFDGEQEHLIVDFDGTQTQIPLKKVIEATLNL